MNLDALTSMGSGDKAASHVPAPKRRWMTRVALPVSILLICGGLLAYAARDALIPATPVNVVRVVAKEGGDTSTGTGADAAPATASVSVQAPGWLEPDPYPTYLTALTNGIIKEVLVLEGEPVKVGQVVATLVDDDARLALARAKADVARKQAHLTAAQSNWDNPTELNRNVAVSKARVAEANAEQDQLNATIAQQVAKQKELQAAYDSVRELSGGASSRIEIETAQFKVIAQQSLVEGTRKLQPVIDAQLQRFKAELKAANEALRLRINERKALHEATAALDEAKAARDEAQLRLTRMKVTSTVDGIVMNRMVAPGAKVMFEMDSPHSAHVVHVYNPEKMQVRVDVPLADAAKIGAGQEARVVVDVLPEHAFVGRVTRFVHLADISKNTVEVKVAIENPSPLLKPDMLARVKFLASTKPTNNESHSNKNAGALTIFIPASAVQESEGQSTVWRVSSRDQLLERQAVTLGGKRPDGWIAVRDGLNPGDVLVANPSANFTNGQRVTIVNTENTAE